MRDLADPYADFVPWYLPSWFSGNDSFPSGHSANAACVLVLTLLPRLLRDRKWLAAIISHALCYGWLLIVMAARIVAGAHFASDVTTGAFITLASFHLFKSIFASKAKINER